MHTSLLVKLLVGGVFAAVASTLAALNWEQIMGSPYRDIVVYGQVGTAITGAPSQALPKDGDAGYKCKLDTTMDGQTSNEEFHCSIQKIVFVNNQWDFSEQSNSTPNTLTIEDLTTEYNVLKISFQSNSYEWEKHKTKKIEIISDLDAGVNKQYSYTNALFAVDKDQKFGSTKQFIGRANKESKTGTTLPGSYKCSWSDVVESSATKDCSVYEFDITNTSQTFTTQYPSLSFNKGSSAATRIKKDYYYFIEFSKDEVSEIKDRTIMFAKESTSDDDEKITMSIIKSAFLVNNNLVVVGS